MLAYRKFLTRGGHKATVRNRRWRERFDGYLGFINIDGVDVEWAWTPEGKSIDPHDTGFDIMNWADEATTPEYHWHSVDTAPKDGTELILASWAEYLGKSTCWWVENSFWGGEFWVLSSEMHNAHHGAFPATHWLPIVRPKKSS